MTDDGDRDLRERFTGLRAGDGARLRSFRATVATGRARTPKPRRRLVVAAAGAAVVLTVAVAVWTARPEPPEPFAITLDLSATRWHAPSDFLLETPWRDLLREVPRIGTIEGLGSPPVGFDASLSSPEERRNP